MMIDSEGWLITCTIILMKLIVGLGNPGEGYENTRHNVGFMVIDRMAGEEKFSNNFDAQILKRSSFILVKPQTYMNRSGKAVKEILDFFKLEPRDLILIHDDLDIGLGKYKIEACKGPKQHNGITSVEESIGTKDFLRVRVGVDNRDQGAEIPPSPKAPEGRGRMPGERYVLENFSDEEEGVLNKIIIEAVEKIKELI